MSYDAPNAKRHKPDEPTRSSSSASSVKVCSRLHVHFWVWDAIVGGHKVMEYRDQAVWGTAFLSAPSPYTHLKLWRAYTSTYALIKIGRVHTHRVAHSTCFQAGPYSNNPAYVMPFPGVRTLLCIPLLEILHVGVNKNK